VKFPFQIKPYNRGKVQSKELAIIEFFDITFTWVQEERDWCIEFTIFNFGILISKSMYKYD